MEGEGKPLTLKENPLEDPEWRLANKILADSGFAPGWIQKRREIEDDHSVRIVANDFLALGGDDILTTIMPEGGFEIRYDMPLTRDALVAWFRAGPPTLDPADFRTHEKPKWTVPDIIPNTCRF